MWKEEKKANLLLRGRCDRQKINNSEKKTFSSGLLWCGAG